jgi:membrane protease YdiL (CAAX protease family)
MRPLEQAIAATADGDPRPWAPQRAFSMLLTIVVVIVLFGSAVAATGVHDDWRAAWATVLGEVALGVPVVYFAWPAAQASGGWGPGLGLVPPRWRDVPIALGWTVVQFLARIVASIILFDLLPAARHERVSNVPSLANDPWTVLVPLFLAVTVMAPVVEELAFRGFLLRSFTRRWGYPIAAMTTAVLFGLLHFEQAGGVAASVVLAATLAVFGYLQASLVRRTARLAPAMIVHGLTNLVGVVAALHLHLHLH